MMRASGLPLLAACLAVWPGSAEARDFDSRTIAFIHDAFSATPPAGSTADAAVFADVQAALRSDGLLTKQRVSTTEPDTVDAYGRALMLGTRARQFLPELAEVRNAAFRQDRAATAAAIDRLYTKAGRSKPDAAQMEKFVDAVTGAGASEGPAETVRNRLEKPGRTIDITDAKRAGLFTIEVTSTPPGGQPTRTVVVAERTVKPDSAGTGLEQRAAPVHVCTVTTAQATERRAALNGAWQDRNGDSWDVSGTGESITLVERRAGKPAMPYTGTYKLGRIQATHPVGAPNEIDDALPDWVRAGLVGRTSFVVRLDDCGLGRMLGTWESRHVTYNPTFRTIGRIHDPYDLSLQLDRGGMKMARGGRFPEEGP
jgi:hypothetical protein